MELHNVWLSEANNSSVFLWNTMTLCHHLRSVGLVHINVLKLVFVMGCSCVCVCVLLWTWLIFYSCFRRCHTVWHVWHLRLWKFTPSTDSRWWEIKGEEVERRHWKGEGDVWETDSQTDRQWCRRECWVKRTKDRTVQANSFTPPPSLSECRGGKHGGLGAETSLWVGVGATLCRCVCERVSQCVCVFVCVLAGSVRVGISIPLK